MARATEKKPVGFATHIVAGGMAGAMEAVRNSILLYALTFDIKSGLALLPALGYD
jgi:hypothetical protein